MEKYKRGYGIIQTTVYMLPFTFMLTMLILFLIIPNMTYSISEQRYLAQFPSPSIEEVLNGSYMTKFEKYFSDQFPFRSLWIQIKQHIG